MDKELYTRLIAILDDHGKTWEKIQQDIISEAEAIDIFRCRDYEVIPDKLITVDKVIEILRDNL